MTHNSKKCTLGAKKKLLSLTWSAKINNHHCSLTLTLQSSINPAKLRGTFS